MEKWREAWAGAERVAFGMDPAARAVHDDRYGSGELPERLESRVAGLLGKEAAVWMPSGTMAQQIALRIHAERTGRSAVAFHPYCHLDTHEERAYEALHGLRAALLGSRERLIGREDVEGLGEPVAALLLELPQRDLGGLLPAWDDLAATCAAARERGAASTSTARASGSAARSTAAGSTRSRACSTRSTSPSTRISQRRRAAPSPGRPT